MIKKHPHLLELSLAACLLQAFPLYLHAQPDRTGEFPVSPSVPYVGGEIIVKLKVPVSPLSGERQARQQAVLSRLKTEFQLRDEQPVFPAPSAAGNKRRTASDADFLSVFLLRTSNDVPAACRDLNGHPDVEYAEPNYLCTSDYTPDDALFAEQWSHLVTEAKAAWDLEQGSNGVTIAVIDSGVDYTHEDLAGNIWRNPGEIAGNGVDDDANGYVDDTMGWDFVHTTNSECTDPDPMDPDNDPQDNQGHGTHCAGIAAAVTGNGPGVAGVCPNASIMPLRTMWANAKEGASGSSADVAKAIKYAADNGADIISMSLGSSDASSTMRQAVDYAHGLGAMMFASAGNSGADSPRYPAAFTNVVAVGSSGADDERLSSFSNFGSWIDIVAPGDNILSTVPGNDYVRKSGTSMACPYAAGQAALLHSRHPGWSAEEVRSVMKSAADRVVADARGYRYGRVNLRAALDRTVPLVVRIEAPAPDQVFELATDQDITGTVIGPLMGYTLECGIGYEPADFVAIAAGNQEVQGGRLGTLTGLVYGAFTVRLNATSPDGHTYSDRITFVNKGASPPMMDGWNPKIFGSGGFVVSPATVVDLDGDGDQEVFVHSLPGNVYGFDHLGNDLPGWPQSSHGDYNCQSKPATGDVDGDGDLEIFVRSSVEGANYIAGWHHDGVPLPGWNPMLAGTVPYGYTKFSVNLADVDTNGILDVVYTSGIDLEMRRFDSTIIAGPCNSAGKETTPRIGDIDHDGDMEIVTAKFGGTIGGLKIFNHQGAGPTTIFLDPNAQGVTDVKLADIDGDNRLEIMASYSIYYALANGDNENDGIASVYDDDYSLVWKQRFDEMTSFFSLGNLDDDPLPEIVIANGWQVYAYNHDQSLVPGWPQDVPAKMSAEVAIGDIDNDGANEVIAMSGNALYAWNRNGALLYEDGFPMRMSEMASSCNAKTPVITDLDGDSDVDIVVVLNAATVPTHVYVVDLPHPFDLCGLDWPMAEHDPQNTGLYRAGGASRPGNDDLAEARPLSGETGRLRETNCCATAEPGEPAHAGIGPLASLWWTFVPETNGTLSLWTRESAFNTVLALYTGTAVTSLQEIAANDDDGSASHHSGLWGIPLLGGTTYRIVVASAQTGGGCLGNFRLNWDFHPSDGGDAYNVWNLAHWPSGDSGGRTNDADGDGQSNFQEWIAGSDPTNAASAFSLGAIEKESDATRISWEPAPSNRLYDLYWTSNLLSEFQLIQQNLCDLPLGNGTWDEVDRGEVGFYRIHVKW